MTNPMTCDGFNLPPEPRLVQISSYGIDLKHESLPPAQYYDNSTAEAAIAGSTISYSAQIANGLFHLDIIEQSLVEA
ncbi:MAG: hypothetical protein IGS50_24435 [Synechococcales cyanobacterium C42_A2020_086]|jgi:hypothetical protein|nr:hypothetical protein [Synechococcales cyanobacterium M58_A2018_015]MBF2076889.1 hypothetical protein [Synechococcales cyanobacterium C42_A2020_086]